MSEGSSADEKPRQRTPAQTAALQRARLKAIEVRQKNKELRDKQREVDRIAIEQRKRENSERIQREYEALTTARRKVPGDDSNAMKVVRIASLVPSISISHATNGKVTTRHVQIIYPCTRTFHMHFVTGSQHMVRNSSENNCEQIAFP